MKIVFIKRQLNPKAEGLIIFCNREADDPAGIDAVETELTRLREKIRATNGQDRPDTIAGTIRWL